MQTELSHDDLLWLIGQKDVTLLLLARQMKTMMAENEHLNTQIKALTSSSTQELPHGTDNGQTLNQTVPAETAS